MAKHYLLTVADEHSRLLEGWLGYGLQIVPNGAPAGIPVAGLDAVTDDEVAGALDRLKHGGPIYHAGGPS